MSERSFDPQGARLPNAVQLEARYDAARMRAELAAFAAGSGDAFGAAGGRRVLPLRSPGGDPRRTDAGGPNLYGFRATPWLRRLPYFGEIIDSLPGPVRGARLWAAAPGVRAPDMRAPKVGPSWGLCRLHLPVAGGPQARSVFVGEHQHWAPGSLWFAASWRSHVIVNADTTDLVHLIVDLFHTPEVEALFPAALRRALAGPAALRRRPEVPLCPPDAERLGCRFQLPELFANWEYPGHLMHRGTSRADIEASIGLRAGAPVLFLAGQPFCGLEHVGDGEFRLRGWSDERTVQIAAGPRREAVLRMREGTNTYVVRRPLS